MMIGAAAFAN